MKQTVVSSLAEPVGNLWRNLQEEYTKKEIFILHHHYQVRRYRFMSGL